MAHPKPEIYPLIALPYDTVLFPGRKLQISSVNRQDIIAIIANYYNGALATRGKDKDVHVGCIPLRSPYLSPDGLKLIEPAERGTAAASVPDAAFAKPNDLYQFGVLAKIHGVEGGKTGEIKLVVEGTTRFRLGKIVQEKPYYTGQLTVYRDEVDVWDPAIKAAFAHLKELSRELFQIIRMSSLVSRSSNMPPSIARQLELFVARKDISEAGILADFMAILGQSSYEDKLKMLSAVAIVTRVQRATELLQKQISSLQGNTRIITITNSTHNGVDSERLRQLQLHRDSFAKKSGGVFGNVPGGSPSGAGGGQGEEEANEVEELKKKLDEAGLTPEAQKAASKELKRLQKMNPVQAEYQVIRNYLENLAEIPWSKVTDTPLDASTLQRARKQLDDDHYGLEKVKKRLLEHLAVLRLKQLAKSQLDQRLKSITESQAPAQQEQDIQSTPNGRAEEISKVEAQVVEQKRSIDKSPILLLVGPPGVGKTSLAKSIATALGRKFHRISLGGVRDEAEIRGHRRTYVASMPGLIVAGLKKVGVANPVILLDEIDKIGTSNFHGDPSAAMLEVLDPEQNHTFNDHYVNIPIDLSRVLFIATANTLDTISPPLLDRMETVSLSGYTTVEKRHIASRHLIPKQILSNGLGPNAVQLPEDVLDKIINSYTRESGVRNLEREIGAVCRYKAVQYSDSNDSSASSSASSPSSEATSSASSYNPSVTLEDLDDILGIERFEEELAAQDTPRPGVVTGLVAFSNLGQGSILFIEIAEMPGSGRVQLTGKLGEVLKESVEVALTWVKAHAFALGIAADVHEDIMARRSIHVHCPAGAVPKDGPSAGLAHTVALISLFTGKSVPPTIAMTGEVSLRGKVTPVGGIKEKVIGALRAGVKTVLLPIGNKKDARDLPAEVAQGIQILFVGHIWEALRLVWPNDNWESRAPWDVESRL